ANMRPRRDVRRSAALARRTSVASSFPSMELSTWLPAVSFASKQVPFAPKVEMQPPGAANVGRPASPSDENARSSRLFHNVGWATRTPDQTQKKRAAERPKSREETTSDLLIASLMCRAGSRNSSGRTGFESSHEHPVWIRVARLHCSLA